MKWFILRNPPGLAKEMSAITFSLGEVLFDGISAEDRVSPFTRGMPIKVSGSVPIFRRRLGKVPYLSDHFHGWLAAEQLAEALGQVLMQNVQLFETSSSELELNGLQILNFTRRFDCIDFERSNLRLFEEEPREVQAVFAFVLHEDSIDPNAYVFRPEGALNYVIVSAAGKRLMESAGVPVEYFDSGLFE